MSDLEGALTRLGLAKPPYWDERYIKNIKRLSKPTHKVSVEKDVYLRTRDGTRICVDVYRPSGKGRFPALLASAGYSKDVQWLDVPSQPMQSIIFDHSVEAGDVDFFVKRGYAYVIMDPRGVGKSEGEWYGPYNRQEQEDYYDVIEWVAKQPWCSGKVGMAGISWFGVVQLLAAAQAPPHLKAVFPVEFFTDLYRWSYNGGIVTSYIWDVENKMAVNNPVLESEKRHGKRWVESAVKERLEDPDIRKNSYFYRELVGNAHTAFKDALLHPTDGQFWRDRSSENKLDKIRVPVYLGGFWATDVMIPSIFGALNHRSLAVPKKAGVFLYAQTYGVGLGESGQLWLPVWQLNAETLRWYDHWLKGVDTGIMEEPPIKMLVMGTGRFRYEHEWPLARTKWTRFYLRRFAKLSTVPEDREGVDPDPLVHRPPSISNEQQTLAYTTPPFEQPTEVTGPVALHFSASIDQDDADFIVKLWDVAPDGQKLFLVAGYLKASHRALDAKRSKPWQPYPTHVNPTKVVPGRVYDYSIPMAGISNVFAAGHRMSLEISSMDPLPQVHHHKMTFQSHLMSSRLTYYKIFRDSVRLSHLLVPVIPETPDDLWIR